MENAVPGVLQRLRAADIIRIAGLKAASLGQEYCRLGFVQQTQRQGHRLSGVVDVPGTVDVTDDEAVLATNAEDEWPSSLKSATRCSVEVTLESSTIWQSSCSCDADSAALCSHAAALLYQWLARPYSFTAVASVVLSSPLQVASPTAKQETALASEHKAESAQPAKVEGTLAPARKVVGTQGPMPLTGIAEILGQLGLSELRSIAREYEVTTNGLSKSQLVEAILRMHQQPDVVRRMAATLEKPQRQLLAALALAGGSMMDDDLRGMFERFALGQPSQFQNVLMALQSKGLLFRTSLNGSSQQRIGLGSALLDIGWFVPPDVRSALRATLPSTMFDVERPDESGTLPTLQLGSSQRLLTTLLLVARMLDGSPLEQADKRESNGARSSGSLPSSRLPALLSSDGSIALPMPEDTLSSALLASLQQAIPAPAPLLRFAARLLRLADVLYLDGSGTSSLQALKNAASLLLGPAQMEVLHDLFELWLTQASYDELCELQEEGLRLRCRATSLNYPLVRINELEAENSEARQAIVALLAQAPSGRWLSFAAFARFVYRLNPLFLQRRQRLFSLPHWWLEREEGRPLRPLSLSDWSHAEYHYLVRLLRGPLHWWGICDLALGADGRLLAFRLTPLARWLLNGAQLDEEEIAEATACAEEEDAGIELEVSEQDTTLVACSPQAWPMIKLLEDFAEVAGVRNGKLLYHLSPLSLAAALSRGLQPTPLLDLLRSVAPPDDTLARVLTQLERWIGSYGRVRIYTQVALLEVADSVVMRELSATTSLDQQIVHTLHPTMHILKRSGAERLIDDLKRRGQVPLLHSEEKYGTE